VLTQLGLLMMFQFAGEALVTSVGIAFPGPLCGMLLLLVYLYLRGGASDDLSHVGSRLIDHLGLLFVPAGTAIVAYGALFAIDGIAIIAALVVSTLLAVLIGGAIASLAEIARTERPSCNSPVSREILSALVALILLTVLIGGAIATPAEDAGSDVL
jgi:holin-like protein